MKALHKIAFVLLIIGGLNWGLEVFGWGVARFVGDPIAKVVYILVALAAIVEIFGHKSMCKACDNSMAQPM